MFSIEDLIIAAFCCVDKLLQVVKPEYPMRWKGFVPALSSSELMTMEIVAEYQGIDTDIGK